MNVEEKERLIKKDIAMIENKVRHAFNQGYEMGVKELKAYKEQGGDAISRQAVLDATVKKNSIWNMITNSKGENLEEIISQLPSVTPQQRIGRWIKTRLDDEPDKICDDCGTYCWKCSICGSDASGWGNYKYCPNCGAKMEVEG